VKADAGVALSTGPAAAACDVERHRYEVANLKILDVAASLDRLAGDLVSKHHASRPCRAAPDHVLVGATDIRRYDLEDDAVIDRLSCRIAEGRKVDLLNFDAAGFEVNHPPIGDTVISSGSHSGLRFDALGFSGWPVLAPTLRGVWPRVRTDDAVSAYELPMKMPATARRPRITPSLYHDDALTDALAEARADAWARVGLTLGTGQRQLNNFSLLEIGAKTSAITATEPKQFRSGWIHFNFAPGFAQRNSVYRQRCESKH
jgi:hypothetical protein